MAIHKIDQVDGVNHFPKKFVTLRASEAITKGDLVALDLSDSTNGLGASIRPADVATDASGGVYPIALGFATETAAAGAECKVQTAGKFVDANVHSDTVAGDSLYASIVAGRAHPRAEANAGLNISVAAGVSATTNVATAGILLKDSIEFVFETDTGTDRTSTASIDSDGNVENSADTSSNVLLIGYRRDLSKIAYALEVDTANAADVMILDQGLF